MYSLYVKKERNDLFNFTGGSNWRLAYRRPLKENGSFPAGQSVHNSRVNRYRLNRFSEHELFPFYFQREKEKKLLKAKSGDIVFKIYCQT